MDDTSTLTESDTDVSYDSHHKLFSPGENYFANFLFDDLLLSSSSLSSDNREPSVSNKSSAKCHINASRYEKHSSDSSDIFDEISIPSIESFEGMNPPNLPIVDVISEDSSDLEDTDATEIDLTYSNIGTAKTANETDVSCPAIFNRNDTRNEVKNCCTFQSILKIISSVVHSQTPEAKSWPLTLDETALRAKIRSFAVDIFVANPQMGPGIFELDSEHSKIDNAYAATTDVSSAGTPTCEKENSSKPHQSTVLSSTDESVVILENRKKKQKSTILKQMRKMQRNGKLNDLTFSSDSSVRVIESSPTGDTSPPKPTKVKKKQRNSNSFLQTYGDANRIPTNDISKVSEISTKRLKRKCTEPLKPIEFPIICTANHQIKEVASENVISLEPSTVQTPHNSDSTLNVIPNKKRKTQRTSKSKASNLSLPKVPSQTLQSVKDVVILEQNTVLDNTRVCNDKLVSSRTRKAEKRKSSIQDTIEHVISNSMASFDSPEVLTTDILQTPVKRSKLRQKEVSDDTNQVKKRRSSRSLKRVQNSSVTSHITGNVVQQIITTVNRPASTDSCQNDVFSPSKSTCDQPSIALTKTLRTSPRILKRTPSGQFMCLSQTRNNKNQSPHLCTQVNPQQSNLLPVDVDQASIAPVNLNTKSSVGNKKQRSMKNSPKIPDITVLNNNENVVQKNKKWKKSIVQSSSDILLPIAATSDPKSDLSIGQNETEILVVAGNSFLPKETGNCGSEIRKKSVKNYFNLETVEVPSKESIEETTARDRTPKRKKNSSKNKTAKTEIVKSKLKSQDPSKKKHLEPKTDNIPLEILTLNTTVNMMSPETTKKLDIKKQQTKNGSLLLKDNAENLSKHEQLKSKCKESKKKDSTRCVGCMPYVPKSQIPFGIAINTSRNQKPVVKPHVKTKSKKKIDSSTKQLESKSLNQSLSTTTDSEVVITIQDSNPKTVLTGESLDSLRNVNSSFKVASENCNIIMPDTVVKNNARHKKKLRQNVGSASKSVSITPVHSSSSDVQSNQSSIQRSSELSVENNKSESRVTNSTDCDISIENQTGTTLDKLCLPIHSTLHLNSNEQTSTFPVTDRSEASTSMWCSEDIEIASKDKLQKVSAKSVGFLKNDTVFMYGEPCGNVSLSLDTLIENTLKSGAPSNNEFFKDFFFESLSNESSASEGNVDSEVHCQDQNLCIENQGIEDELSNENNLANQEINDPFDNRVVEDTTVATTELESPQNSPESVKKRIFHSPLSTDPYSLDILDFEPDDPIIIEAESDLEDDEKEKEIETSQNLEMNPSFSPSHDPFNTFFDDDGAITDNEDGYLIVSTEKDSDAVDIQNGGKQDSEQQSERIQHQLLSLEQKNIAKEHGYCLRFLQYRNCLYGNRCKFKHQLLPRQSPHVEKIITQADLENVRELCESGVLQKAFQVAKPLFLTNCDAEKRNLFQMLLESSIKLEQPTFVEQLYVDAKENCLLNQEFCSWFFIHCKSRPLVTTAAVQKMFKVCMNLNIKISIEALEAVREVFLLEYKNTRWYWISCFLLYKTRVYSDDLSEYFVPHLEDTLKICLAKTLRQDNLKLIQKLCDVLKTIKATILKEIDQFLIQQFVVMVDHENNSESIANGLREKFHRCFGETVPFGNEVPANSSHIRPGSLIPRAINNLNSELAQFQTVEVFIQQQQWVKLASLYNDCILRNDLNVLLEFQKALISDRSKVAEKFSNFLLALTNSAMTLQGLPASVIFTVSQIGTTLMLTAYQIGDKHEAFNILQCLHLYDINYYNLQKFLLKEENLSGLTLSQFEYIVMPWTVAFAAVDVCIETEHFSDALALFRGFDWIPISLNFPSHNKILLERLRLLCKLSHILCKKTFLKECGEVYCVLLDSFSQYSSEIGYNEDFSLVLNKNLNSFLAHLLDHKNFDLLTVLSKHFLLENSAIAVWDDILRASIIAFSESGNMIEAEKYFKFCIKKNVYSLDLTINRDYCQLRLPTHLTTCEIQFIVNEALDEYFTRMSHRSYDNSFKMDQFCIVFKQTSGAEQQTRFASLKSISTLVQDAEMRTFEVLQKLNLSYQVLDNMEDNGIIELSPDTIFTSYLQRQNKDRRCSTESTNDEVKSFRRIECKTRLDKWLENNQSFETNDRFGLATMASPLLALPPPFPHELSKSSTSFQHVEFENLALSRPNNETVGCDSQSFAFTVTPKPTNQNCTFSSEREMVKSISTIALDSNRKIILISPPRFNEQNDPETSSLNAVCTVETEDNICSKSPVYLPSSMMPVQNGLSFSDTSQNSKFSRMIQIHEDDKTSIGSSCDTNIYSMSDISSEKSVDSKISTVITRFKGSCKKPEIQTVLPNAKKRGLNIEITKSQPISKLAFRRSRGTLWERIRSFLFSSIRFSAGNSSAADFSYAEVEERATELAEMFLAEEQAANHLSNDLDKKRQRRLINFSKLHI